MFEARLLSRVKTLQAYTCRTMSDNVKDPIQQLFLDKIREYKHKSLEGKLVDPSPAIQKELKKEIAKLDKRYGGGPDVDMTVFPTFKFDEPKLDSINEAIAVPKKKKKKRKKTKNK